MLRMSKFSWLAWLASMLVLGTSACVPPGGAGKAGADGATQPLGRKTEAKLREAGAQMQKQQWDKALAELEGDPADLNPHEQARVLQMKAQIHLLSNHIDEGVSELEQAVALKAMPKADQLQAQYLLAQAYLHQERYAESADTFEAWLKETKQPTAENHFDVARADARAKRFKLALPHAKKAVEMSEKPEEARLALLAWIHVELKQHAEGIAVQEQLVNAFPKKEYWLQLAQTYLDSKNPKRAAETLEVPYTKGLLTEEQELVTLARLYLKAGEGAKGAELLRTQMESGKIEKSAQNSELLASCYIQSGDTEHGEATLELVGKEVSSGQVFLDLGRAHFAKQRWEPARDALARSVTTGGLRYPGSAQLLLGITHYKLKRKDAALASLTRAKAYPSAMKCSEDWIAAIKKNKKDTEGECAVASLSIKDPTPVPAKKPVAAPAAGAAAPGPAPTKKQASAPSAAPSSAKKH